MSAHLLLSPEAAFAQAPSRKLFRQNARTWRIGKFWQILCFLAGQFQNPSLCKIRILFQSYLPPLVLYTRSLRGSHLHYTTIYYLWRIFTLLFSPPLYAQFSSFSFTIRLNSAVLFVTKIKSLANAWAASCKS